MFQMKIEKGASSFLEDGLPAFFREIEEKLLERWRASGYRTRTGSVELASETADTAYYFDVRRGRTFLRLVVGLKETDGALTLTFNSVYYPRERRYVILAAVAAGFLTGSLFYYAGVKPFVYSGLGAAVGWALAVLGSFLLNYVLIRYFYRLARTRVRPSGANEALELERQAKTLAREKLSEYGGFIP